MRASIMRASRSPLREITSRLSPGAKFSFPLERADRSDVQRVGWVDHAAEGGQRRWRSIASATSWSIMRQTGPADAPLLVLVNSLGTDLRVWDALLPSLADRFRCSATTSAATA